MVANVVRLFCLNRILFCGTWVEELSASYIIGLCYICTLSGVVTLSCVTVVYTPTPAQLPGTYNVHPPTNTLPLLIYISRCNTHLSQSPVIDYDEIEWPDVSASSRVAHVGTPRFPWVNCKFYATRYYVGNSFSKMPMLYKSSSYDPNWLH